MVEKTSENYTSTEIKNEMSKIMSLSILSDAVPAAIECLDNRSIMVEEFPDASYEEQAVFRVRWIDEDLIPHEDFICLYETEKTDATNKFTVIKYIILQLDLDQGSCR